MKRMRKVIRRLAVILFVGAVASWAVAGANRGWTKTSVPRKVVDQVTGLEGVEWQTRFVPGVDFLGAALLGAGGLLAISFFVPAKPKQPRIETRP